LQGKDGGIGGGGGRFGLQAWVDVDAEIGGLEQFLQKNDLRALPGCTFHQIASLPDVVGAVPAAGHLRYGNGNKSHGRFLGQGVWVRLHRG
jgi:hypothetical protein